MASLSAEFPSLPDHFEGGCWSANVVKAHLILSDAHHHAYEVLHASESDTYCL